MPSELTLRHARNHKLRPRPCVNITEPAAPSTHRLLAMAADFTAFLRPYARWRAGLEALRRDATRRKASPPASGKKAPGSPKRSDILQKNARARQKSAMIMSLVSGFLVLCALSFNIFEHNADINLPLLAAAAVALFSFITALYKNPQLSMVTMSLALMALGGYLLFSYPDGAYSKLFWFLLLPPMLMLCLGEIFGSLLFFIFFSFLTLAFIGPLQAFMANQYSPDVSVRFLTAMFGAWIFSLLSERSSHHARLALAAAMDRLEHEAMTDSLTGLGNRRSFQNFSAWLKKKAVREERPYCLAILDIDHFKAINDRYGHAIGDLVLRHTAELLELQIRAGGRAFRWGGEEFIVLIPDVAPEGARIAMERLRCAIKNTPCRHDGLEISYTISIGLHCGSPEEDMRIQIAQADEALYRAKRNGRDQVRASCLD